MQQAPERIRQWLLERLSEAPLFELLGRDVLAMIAQRGAEFFYRDGVLRTEELIKWLTGEYGLPPDQTIEFFTSLQKAAAPQGIEIALPGPEPPASPKVSAPAPAPAPELKAPQPVDHRRHLGSFLQDAAFLEWAVLDHARGGDAPKPEVVAKALDLRLRLAEPEIELLADPSLEPGGAGDRPADWTLRLHGLSLALAAALHIAANRMDFPQTQWTKAVRELLANFEGVAVQVRAKLEREAGEDSPLAEAWRRTSGLRDELTLRLDEVEGPGGAKAPAASRAPSGRAARPRRSAPDRGLRGRVNRQPVLVGAVAVALVAAAGLLAWLLSGPETRPLDLTLDLESPRVEKIEAAPGLMIVTVDEASWTALDEQTKKSALQVMGEAATKNGLATVNVRAADETPLGVYLTSSGDFMILR